jgi:hypothetical protein
MNGGKRFGGGRPPTGTPSLAWSSVVIVASLLAGASIVHNIYKPDMVRNFVCPPLPHPPCTLPVRPNSCETLLNPNPLPTPGFIFFFGSCRPFHLWRAPAEAAARIPELDMAGIGSQAWETVFVSHREVASKDSFEYEKHAISSTCEHFFPCVLVSAFLFATSRCDYVRRCNICYAYSHGVIQFLVCS